MQKSRTNRIKVFNKIIRLIVKNPEKGLDNFYKEYGDMIYSVAKSYCHTEDKTNSVVNNVLIRIWKKAKDLNDVQNPEGLIFTITKNCAKDELGEKWFYELNEKISSGKDYFSEIEEKDSFEYLISPLKDHEKDILILRFGKGYTFQEIADIEEKPLPTITTIYYRALDKIKNFIKDKSFE